MRALACVLLIACGGGGEVEGEPLIQSALTAKFEGVPWTPMYGFARMENTSFVFFLGSSKISCADDFEGRPREGTYAAFGLTGAPAVGTSSTNPANLVKVADGDLAMHIAPGMVMVTAVSETEVSATVDYDAGGQDVLEGTATFLRCP